jgi:hypothetical protein
MSCFWGVPNVSFAPVQCVGVPKTVFTPTDGDSHMRCFSKAPVFHSHKCNRWACHKAVFTPMVSPMLFTSSGGFCARLCTVSCTRAHTRFQSLCCPGSCHPRPHSRHQEEPRASRTALMKRSTRAPRRKRMGAWDEHACEHEKM